jgi:hypothetical protein
VADRDAPLPAGSQRLADDLARVQMLRLVAEVDVEVRVDAELRREREDDLDVPARVGVVVRSAAHEVGAHAECLAQ